MKIRIDAKIRNYESKIRIFYAVVGDGKTADEARKQTEAA